MKLADLAHHNFDESRNALADVTEKKRECWRRKYAKAKEMLDPNLQVPSPQAGPMPCQGLSCGGLAGRSSA